MFLFYICMNFNKYARVINKLNEMAMDGSDTLLLKTAFLLKKVDIKVWCYICINHYMYIDVN